MPPIYISFTAHRNRVCDEADLFVLHKEFPDAIWVHGGAIGFDRLVEQYAFKHQILTWVIRLDYEKYGRQAPLIRDEDIVRVGVLPIALYDGRQFGGTYFTLKKAKVAGKEIRIWKPLHFEKGYFKKLLAITIVASIPP
jgi:hypothetical protein